MEIRKTEDITNNDFKTPGDAQRVSRIDGMNRCGGCRTCKDRCEKCASCKAPATETGRKKGCMSRGRCARPTTNNRTRSTSSAKSARPGDTIDQDGEGKVPKLINVDEKTRKERTQSTYSDTTKHQDTDETPSQEGNGIVPKLVNNIEALQAIPNEGKEGGKG